MIACGIIDDQRPMVLLSPEFTFEYVKICTCKYKAISKLEVLDQ